MAGHIPARAWALTYLGAVIEGPNHRLADALRGGVEPEKLARGIARQESWVDDEIHRRAAARRTHIDAGEIYQRGIVSGARLIARGDPEWPTIMDEAMDFLIAPSNPHPKSRSADAAAPVALWVRGGNLARCSERSVAIVGTRRLSRYGHDVTRELTEGLASHGWSIVSGGAFGVDAVAHRSALDNKAPTVAVMACGIDRVYPAKHAGLIADIVAADGAVVSEAPPGASPARHRFLSRNRIVAALSAGTLVTEASWRSGALNTLSWAAAQGRITMAVPGPINTPSSRGTNEALRQGRAEMVCSVDDARALITPVGTVGDTLFHDPRDFSPVSSLSRLQLLIHDSVAHTPRSSTVIARRAGVAVPLAIVTLGELVNLQLVAHVEDGWVLCDGGNVTGGEK